MFAATSGVVPSVSSRSRRRSHRKGGQKPLDQVNLTAPAEVFPDCRRLQVRYLKNPEVFTFVAIEVILRLSIWGARLRWAARADNEPTATEGGDPSGTYNRWLVAT